MVDDKVLCTLEKPFEWRTIEGLMICSAMSLSDSPSVTNRTIGNRLLVRPHVHSYTTHDI